MALKDIIKSLAGKKDLPAAAQDNTPAPLPSEAFPVYRADQFDLSRYKKIPLASLAAMGAAFSQLPEGARTVTQALHLNIKSDLPLFWGIFPNVDGRMIDKGKGFTSLVHAPQGQKGIVAHARYKFAGDLPMTGTGTMVMPIDPVSVAIATALFSIEQKMDEISAKVEEVLQFLKREKQSEQRGNLNMLAEIMAEFKQGHMDEQLCTVRMTVIQEIRRIAHKDMLFYQEQIGNELAQQKTIHATAQAQTLQDQVMGEFCEYQLASYLYAYSTMLDTLIRGKYDGEQLRHTADTLKTQAERYNALYEQCHAQLAHYQRKSVETVLVGGLGSAAKAVGEKLAQVPILSKGPVDELLINAGDSLGRHNRDQVAKRLERFAPLADSRMGDFEASIRALDVAHNQPDGLITDGENIYLLESA